MLLFTDDKFVEIWFSLWKMTAKGFEQIRGKYPLEYTDSRFHRALEKLRTGQYVAIEYGKTPEKSKALEINYTEAEKHYNSGILEEPAPNFTVDWYGLFKKFDDLRNYKKLQSELQLNEQVQEDLEYFRQHEESTKNKALMNAVKMHRNGCRVPAFILPDVLEFIALEARNERQIRRSS